MTETNLYLLGNKCAKCPTFEIHNARPERVMQPSGILEHRTSDTMGHEQMGTPCHERTARQLGTFRTLAPAFSPVLMVLGMICSS